MEDIELSQASERRQEWLSRLRDEFLKLEALLPAPSFMLNDGAPPWVQKIEQEIANVMFPVVKVKKTTRLTPRGMGAVIGHTCGYGVWMMEILEEASDKPVDEDLAAKFTEEQLAQGQKFFNSLVNDWYPALRRLAKRSLCSAVDQGYEDMTQFLQAYTVAFARKPKTCSAAEIGNPATQIYFHLLNHWRFVTAMKSVHELHLWLVSHYGPYRVGELKRLEKICQRIHLHYRPPGRPRRLK